MVARLEAMGVAAELDMESVEDVRDYRYVLELADELADGRILAGAEVAYTAGDPRTLRITRDGRELEATLRGRTDWVDVRVFELCDRVLAAAGDARRFRVYDASDDQCVAVVLLDAAGHRRLASRGLRAQTGERAGDLAWLEEAITKSLRQRPKRTAS